MAHISRAPADLLALADIHPELAAHLSIPQTGPPPQDIFTLRKVYECMNRRYLESFGPHSAEGVSISDRTVPARDGYELPIRTYRPCDSRAPPGPLIVCIHGGGNVGGGLVDEEAHCRLFVQIFGASCVNIDYRLAPEFKQPTQALDCWDAVQWAASHAADLNADPTKGFLVQGISAGALLADIVSRLSRDECLNPPITGQLHIATTVCDPLAMPARYAPEFLSWDQEISGSLAREAMGMFRAWRGGSPHDQWTSPLAAWPSGNSGLPRTVLQVHGRDYFRDIGLVYERVLREEEGIETKLFVYPGLQHGFNVAFAGGEASRRHLEDMLQGIAWLLGIEGWEK